MRAFQQPHFTHKRTFSVLMLLFVLAIGIDDVQAQRFDVKQYTTEDGLITNNITAMLQDQEGHLWFGTDNNGLFQFDGFQSQRINQAGEDRFDDSINTIFQDSENQIWIALTTGGLAKVQDDSLYFPFLYHALNYDTITAINETSEGVLWVGTELNGIYKIEGENITHLSGEGLRSDSITDIVVEEANKVWIATAAGLVLYDGSSFQRFAKSAGDLAIHKLYLDDANNLWLATEQGVFKRDGFQLVKQEFDRNQPLNGITDIIQNSLGDLFILSKTDGVIRVRNGELMSINVSAGINSRDISKFYTDIRQNVWVLTKGKGVFLIRNEKFLKFGAESGLGSSHVFDIQTNGPNGSTWFATANGLRVRSNHKNGFFTRQTIPSPDEEIRKMARYANGDLLLLTNERNLYRFNGQEYEYLNESDSLSTYTSGVFDIMLSSEGEIYAGTDVGLFHFTDSTLYRYSEAEGLPHNFVWHIMEDDRQQIWISTSKGIRLLKEGSIEQLAGLEAIGRGKYYRYSIQDYKGNYWLGTNEGILFYPAAGDTTGPQMRLINNNDGLYAIDTQFLGIDDNKYLWHGTRGGMHRIDLNNFYVNEQLSIVHLGFVNKGIGIPFYHGAIAKESTDRMWFGSHKGAVSYDMENTEFNESAPKVKIHTIKLRYNDGNQEQYNSTILNNLNKSAEIDLDYYQDNLTFQFSALDYEAPEKITYSYRLVGENENWSTLDNERQVSYSNLEPGSYTFQVRAKDGHGVWSEEPALLRFAINKSYWYSSQFYGLLILFGMGLIYAGGKVWLNTYEKRKLEQLVDKQTEDLREGLREKEVLLAEVHHRVKNNLAVISGLIELQKNGVHDPDAQRAMQETKARIKSIAMIHEKLYKADTYNDINFQQYIEELVEIISRSYNLNSKTIQIHIETEDIRVTLDQSIPCALILNELLSNAYEHAFANREKGNIYVKLWQHEGKVHMCVEDDGVGLPEDSSNSNDSLGMTLIHILSKQLAAEKTVKNSDGTSIEISFDKKASNKGHIK